MNDGAAAGSSSSVSARDSPSPCLFVVLPLASLTTKWSNYIDGHLSSDPRLVLALFDDLCLNCVCEPFASIKPFVRFGRYICTRTYLHIK